MKNFHEFYEDKEYYEQPLTEDALSAIITGALGIPLVLAFGWAASWVTRKYIEFTRKLFVGLITNIKVVGQSFLKDKRKTKDKVEETIKNIEKAPEVKKASRQIEKIHDKYSNELLEIYKAIDDKQIDNARELFLAKSENIQENPEVKVAIVQQILEVYEEPPMYVTSPGNDTFQAIKKILGQKVARAMEELGKRSFTKYYEEVKEDE